MSRIDAATATQAQFLQRAIEADGGAHLAGNADAALIVRCARKSDYFTA